MSLGLADPLILVARGRRMISVLEVWDKRIRSRGCQASNEVDAGTMLSEGTNPPDVGRIIESSSEVVSIAFLITGVGLTAW